MRKFENHTVISNKVQILHHPGLKPLCEFKIWAKFNLMNTTVWILLNDHKGEWINDKKTC